MLPSGLAATAGPVDGRPAAGSGELVCALVAGASAAVRVAASAPLKLLVPRPRGPAVWAFAATFGGGLVAGDRIDLALEVRAGATALLGTQSSTKIYRSDGAVASQRLRARVADGATLAILPDPVTAFAGARYAQDQRFDLDQDGSLLLLERLTCGRQARDERWAFSDYRSRNQVLVGGRPLLVDGLRLSADGLTPIAERLGSHGCLASVVLVGPRFAATAQALVRDLAAEPATGRGPLLACASALGDGAILRLAAIAHEPLEHWLRQRLAPALAVLGGDPWQRKA